MKTSKKSFDETLERERVKRYQLLIEEYKLIKAKRHPEFKFVDHWTTVRKINKKIFLKFFNRFKENKDAKAPLPKARGPKPAALRSADNSVLEEKLFSILHAPPSLFGINRTTWKLSDIRGVMQGQGYKIARNDISKITKKAGYRYVKAKVCLTSNDVKYQEKLKNITSILSNLRPNEKFFSIAEFGPIAIRMKGGRSLLPKGEFESIEQIQKSKGYVIVTAALELSSNQITHFFSLKKNSEETMQLIQLLQSKYSDQKTLYMSWDSASWHRSKEVSKKVDELNSKVRMPAIKIVPLPSCAQFLNVIESVFSGMAKAIIHNSDYASEEECDNAINTYFNERNKFYQTNQVRAGKKIWGKEIVEPNFSESNNCKDRIYYR